MRTLISRLALLSFVAASAAQNTMSDDGQGSSGKVGWISPDSRRSTWDIIWSCLTVFILCSWKCVHLNLPTTEQSQSVWHKWRGIPYWPSEPLWEKWGRRFAAMVVIVIAPEYVVAIAVAQYRTARRALKRVEDKYGMKYSMTHAFFANMGGFVMRRRKTEAEGTEGPEIGVYEERFLSLDNIAVLEEAGFHIEVSEDDIKDQSKADAITKVLAITQSGWLIVQSIARVACGLAITELELMTLGFILCAVITYIAWWNKPFGVERRRTIVDRGAQPPSWNLRDMDQDGEFHRYDVETRQYYNLFQPTSVTSKFEVPGLSNASDVFWFDRSGNTSVVALYLTGAAFCAIHTAAWNWVFPDARVRIVWNALSVAALATSVLPLCLFYLEDREPFVKWDAYANATFALSVISWMLYSSARLGLLVLTFYCLSSQPDKVYEDLNWTAFLPHFS